MEGRGTFVILRLVRRVIILIIRSTVVLKDMKYHRDTRVQSAENLIGNLIVPSCPKSPLRALLFVTLTGKRLESECSHFCDVILYAQLPFLTSENTVPGPPKPITRKIHDVNTTLSEAYRRLAENGDASDVKR